MAYFAPVITAAGLSVPGYTDIRDSLTASYQAVYGSTTYLGNDAADYQFITALALKFNDAMGLCLLAYNARSPQTAIGTALDAVIKCNGLTRLSASSSSAVLTLSGTAGITVTGGIVSDANGNLWTLPSPATVGTSVTATCQTAGAVGAAAGTINTIAAGYTAGWTGVTNTAAAVVGTAIEADSNLRARQAISVALPSLTRLAGTAAGIKAIAGVTRSNVLENFTSVTDAYGNEGHSLTAVVEGGTDLAVATAIFNNRGIGPNTQGATVPSITIVPVADPNTGAITDIGFVRPVYVPIHVALSIHGLASGFTTATQSAIIAALVTYLGSLEIGEEVTQSALYGVALSVMSDLSPPLFSIRSLTLGTSSGSLGTDDLPLLFFQVASGDASNVTLTVV